MVYLHKNKNTGDIFYVGIGAKKRPWNMIDRNPYWLNYVKKHGKPEVVIIRKNLSYDAAGEIEIILIKKYKRKIDGGNLTNITIGGNDNPMNHAEIRELISIKNKGRIFSDETRKRMSVSAKKRGFTDGLRKAWDRNRKNGINGMMTQEARDKQSEATKGRKKSKTLCIKNGKAHSKKVMQKSLDGKVINTFKSQRAAAKKVGCTAALIGMCVAGHVETAKGFTWHRVKRL